MKPNPAKINSQKKANIKNPNKTTPNKTTPNKTRGNTKTSRAQWLAEARNLLIHGGVENVKIDRLSKNLKVSRGGYYWFFQNRQHILDLLLADWSDEKNDPLLNALNGQNATPLEPFFRFFTRLLRERSYSPKLDSAMRDWGRHYKDAAEAVEQVDNRRIEALRIAFLGLDYSPAEAFIRARILYFHQIGYYSMKVIETETQRQQYLPIYFKQLTGFDLPDEILDRLYENDTN
ncbi:MAG: TetR/AcrR family transcriptional regulator [Rhizobiales bacterium]|nr:TetR/AcrR family transcriptional regulator [Hyphomicrobiales bacterium]NRB15384.1 TetR/AcrR family transcriptional regulator [Hyphomicrobiales bacterium]